MISYLIKNGSSKGMVNHRSLFATSHLKRSTVAQEKHAETVTQVDSDEYQFIQKSKVPTMHFQPSLLRLPIPKLADTCRRYLNAQKPLLSESQLKETEACVSKLLNEEGPSLQEELIKEDKKNKHTSYICEPWFDMYLKDRKPLPINYNPLLVFVPETDPQYNNQLVKSTNLVISSMRFLRSLRANILEPEVYHLNPKKSDTSTFRTVTGLLPSSISWYGAYLFKAFPLDMSQYHNLFNTTRIPELGKDRIYQDTLARHVIVLRNGHFYAFDVLDESGYIRTPKEIASSLKYILEDNKPPNEHPIGIFTAAERDTWASTRARLLDAGNRETLKKIDSALFALILDDETVDDGDYKKLLRLYLHGNGTNRWFDKSFSLIVTKDGYAGVNFEHSWGDGVAVLRYFQDVKKDISEKPRFHPHEVNHLTGGKSLPIEELQFKVDNKILVTLDEQLNKFQKWTESLSVDYIIHEGFGKEECKKLGVSPDAVMQLAFQIAQYRLEGRSVATYESCSTAAFKHGRTETVRPCTLQTKAVCQAITQKNSNISSSELKKMILECSNAHGTLTKEAAMGQGFDRHLFALKRIAELSGRNKPAIFQDSAYEALNHNILSTSTLSSLAVFAGGFGPVVHDGYGIGYMIQDKMLGATVTSYRDSKDATEYVNSLKHAITDIYNILTKA